MNLIRYRTGRIQANDEGRASLRTPYIIGKILKVKVKYGNPSSEETQLSISTSDDEKIINRPGAKDGLFYPRNWNIQNQEYVGITEVPEGSGALASEPYISAGNLTIDMQASIGDYIEYIEFLIDGRIIKESGEDVSKSDSPVTTSTSGVHNPVYRTRRSNLKLFLKNIMHDITKTDDEAETLLKADIDDLREFIEASLYSYAFDGIDKKTSELIKDYLLRGVVRSYTKDKVMKYLESKGVPKGQANNIYRTENHALRTKVREWSYQKIDPEGELKYKWIGPRDNRRTRICKEISRRTSDGVTMARLKQIINQEVAEAKLRKELPEDYDPREYNPHFSCRHTFVRKF